MENIVDGKIVAVFKSPKVLLTISGFLTQDQWIEKMKLTGAKTIWEFVKRLLPVDAYNIYNYQMIKGDRRAILSNEAILDILSQDEFFVRINIDFTKPLKGADLIIVEKEEDLRISFTQDWHYSFIQRRTGLDYLELRPLGGQGEMICVCNPMRFYDMVLENYNAIIAKKRVFIAHSNFASVTQSSLHGDLIFNWVGASFEKANPTRNNYPTPYSAIPSVIIESQILPSVHIGICNSAQAIEKYVAMANSNTHKQTLARRYIPLAYTRADQLMKDIRMSLTMFGINKGSDIEEIFQGYIEIGSRKKSTGRESFEIVFGVITS